MRILHAIHTLDPHSGGPPEALRQLVRRQSVDGLQPMILTTHVQSMNPRLNPFQFQVLVRSRFQMPRQRLVFYKGMGSLGVLRRFYYIPALRAKLGSLLENPETRPEVVHVHGLFSHLTETACRMASERNIPYVLRPAGGLNDYSLTSRSRLLKAMMVRLSTRANIDNAFAVQATSENEAVELRSRFPTANVVPISHGVSIPRERYLKESGRMFLEKYPISNVDRTILYMARFTEKKRPDLLLRAFLGSSLPEGGWTLVMAGAGPMKSQLQRLAASQPQIKFTGFLTGALKWGALSVASVCCLPSRDENFGVGMAESMAAGTPIMIGEGVQFADAVREHRLGYVVGDSESEWIAALESIREGVPENMGGNGRHYARTQLSWGRVATRLHDLYREATALDH